MKRFIDHEDMAGITLKRIATDLNLSMAAVSAALGTKSTTKVSPETEARVRAYADKLNYRPSLVGKSMRSQHLRQVGILVESDFGSRRCQPIIEMPAIFGLNDFLQKQDWQLNIIDDSGQRSDKASAPRYLRERFLDGLVVVSNSDERNKIIENDIKRFSIPSVFLNSAGEYNCVSIDDRLGAGLATRHLVDLGHRKLIFVGPSSGHHSLVERLRGYRQTLEAEGLEAHVHLMKEADAEDQAAFERRAAHTNKEGRRFLVEKFGADRPTGIVCYDDRVAMILMKALYEGGFSVPEDVSIVGFNDMPFMDLLPTSLTTVRTDFYALGQLAGRLLLELIATGTNHLPSPIIKPELVARQSTSPWSARKDRAAI